MSEPAAARDEAAAWGASLWRNRDYMCWWTGTGLSLLGNSVSVIAFPLLVLFGGGSVFDAGLIAAAGRLGALATRLWGGAIADRYSRKAILITGIAAASGLLAGIDSSATLPAMRRLVPRRQLAARATQEQGLQQAAQLAGSPLAGLLFGIARWPSFGFDAVSFLAASIGIALIRKPLGPDKHAVTARRYAADITADIRDGIRIVAREPFLRYTTAWAATTNLVGSSASCSPWPC